mgnify:FL=1
MPEITNNDLQLFVRAVENDANQNHIPLSPGDTIYVGSDIYGGREMLSTLNNFIRTPNDYYTIGNSDGVVSTPSEPETITYESSQEFSITSGLHVETIHRTLAMKLVNEMPYEELSKLFKLPNRFVSPNNIAYTAKLKVKRRR